jgi:DNA polymerase-3 subunit delta
MRCYPQQLPQLLEKNLASIYLLYGSEPFLIEESASLIRNRVRALGEVDHQVLSLQGEGSSLISQLGQSSLFAAISLIELKIEKLNAQLAVQFSQILQSCAPNTYFLCYASKLSRQNQQAKWFTQIEQKGVVIPHWPLSSLQFTKWVEQRAKFRQTLLSPQMLQMLVYHTEGNCLAAAQEIESLRLICESGTAANFSQHSQYEVSDLCEAALAKQPTRVIKIVSCLKESGTALQLVVWALAQTIRTLLRCTARPEEEISRHLQQAGIRPQSHALYTQALKTNTATKWFSLLPYLSQADKQLKSGDIPSAWRNVLEVSLNLAGTALL